jgi:hypothetical protein
VSSPELTSTPRPPPVHIGRYRSAHEIPRIHAPTPHPSGFDSRRLHFRAASAPVFRGVGGRAHAVFGFRSG